MTHSSDKYLPSKMQNSEYLNLMGKAPNWIKEFIENRENIKFLKERINIPCWIHISQSRLSSLLAQIDRTTGNSGAAQKAWPRMVEKFKNTERADSIYAVIEYGLFEPSSLDTVLHLIVDFIKNPTLRLYLEPLIDDTLFMVRCPDHQLINLLEYYLSFQCTIDQGTLSWDTVKKLYNEKIIKFQSCIYSNLPDDEKLNEKAINPLVTATVNNLNDPIFLQKHLSELHDNFPLVFEKVKEEFGIHPISESPEENMNLSIAGISRILSSPENPLDDIPKHLMPTRLPPDDIIIPHLDRHALSLSDATLQIFQEKRYEVAKKILSFIDQVKDDVDPSKEVRFNVHAVPLTLPPALQILGDNNIKSSYSIVFDAQFLLYGFVSPKPDDMVYLLNSETGDIAPFIVTSKTSDFSFIAQLEGDIDSDTNRDMNFNICIKLPWHLAYEINRIISLPKILSSPHISQPVVDSFIGFASKDKKLPITLVETPFGSCPAIDAANWITKKLIKSQNKTIVFGTNPKVIDQFVSHFSSQVKIPQMNILRLDLPPEVCVEIALNSRQELLKLVSSIDKSYAHSCSTAINSLKLYCPDQVDLIKYLEMLWPLEYISDNQKRIDYLKKSAQIICHLIGTPLQVSNLKVDNVIILDTLQIEDSDLLSILNATNPKTVRLYGNGRAFFRLSRMPDDVISKKAVTIYESKHRDIMEFLGYPNIDSVQPYLAPGIMSGIQIWKCDLSNILDATVASAFLLKLLNYADFLIVADEQLLIHLEMVIRKRASWNNELIMLDKLISIDNLMKGGIQADAIIYCDVDEFKNTKIGYAANAAKLVCWACLSNTDEFRSEEERQNYLDQIFTQFEFKRTLLHSNDDSIENINESYQNMYRKYLNEKNFRFSKILNGYTQTSAKIALNEKFGESLSNPRNCIEIKSVQQLFGLVYSMQLQMQKEKQLKEENAQS